MFSRKILIFYVLFSIFSLSAEESAFATFVQGKAIYYGSRGFVLGVAKMIGMDKPTQIERGHIFEKGNFILVGNGKVDVTYKEGPVISLLKDSKYTVGDKSGELDNGSLFFNNKKADDKDFKIDVKTYTVGVRGTEFLLDMNGVYVRQGEVEVTKKSLFGGETITIKSNQQMLFDDEVVTAINPQKNRYIDTLTNTRSTVSPISSSNNHNSNIDNKNYSNSHSYPVYRRDYHYYQNNGCYYNNCNCE